jgi:hypothetical protein
MSLTTNIVPSYSTAPVFPASRHPCLQCICLEFSALNADMSVFSTDTYTGQKQHIGSDFVIIIIIITPDEAT